MRRGAFTSRLPHRDIGLLLGVSHQVVGKLLTGQPDLPTSSGAQGGEEGCDLAG
ncbi:hypothetical protein FHS43_004940 [Streptosporangium becharense]|uniref:Uncharacterized protein n=1 Tax=Streptosporangium becharense TaxID=1816182 RepID=A0A7W9IBJ6_9ACTN|nr:hypothetical protein [Streptosporangium becharense]MBB2913631.1 hypothetical protein [Streptosporangium becharense]MBB5817712.1 hypothetical protein [Streptosporangium becharense]